MDKSLDLNGTIRPGLDILGNEIVIALKKRIRFKQNPEIYRPGLVLSRPDLSLLEYELGRVEQVHAELGRYRYATQEAFTDVSDVALTIRRPDPESPVRMIPSRQGEAIIRFYRGWVEDCCDPGSDSDTYGETVTADVAALQGVFERITLGKFVAEYKYGQEREKFRATGGDAEAMRELIINREREKNVLILARRLAEHYAFPPEQAERIFQWMIEITIAVEIQYIRERMREEDS